MSQNKGFKILKTKTILTSQLFILLLSKKYWIYFLFNIIYKHSKKLVKISKKVYSRRNSSFSFFTYTELNHVFKAVSVDIYGQLTRRLKTLSTVLKYKYITELFKTLKLVLSNISNSILPSDVPLLKPSILTSNRLNFFIKYKLNIENISVLSSTSSINNVHVTLPRTALNRVYTSNTPSQVRDTYDSTFFSKLDSVYITSNLFSYLNCLYINKQFKSDYFFKATCYDLKDNNTSHNLLVNFYNTNILTDTLSSKQETISTVPTTLNSVLVHEGLQSVVDIKLYNYLMRSFSLFDREEWLYFCSYFYAKIVHVQMFLKYYTKSLQCESTLFSNSKYFMLNNELDYTGIISNKKLKKKGLHKRDYFNDTSTFIDSNRNNDFKQMFHVQKTINKKKNTRI